MAIKCPKCNADNPDTQSFCGDCGTKLGTPEDIHVHTKTLETPFPQFSPGTSLAGRYEIIKELGKGGMGEVYLAEDTNLKRQVAIKVLPKAFSLDKERLARFEREARLLASLNHPNIATIHGLEKSDDQQFLVMELVEGDTLAERINDGPLPIDDALEVCKQIAEGLESAHEKGVIHRDLKPGNIKITAEGKVKILDFGLAKPHQEEPEAIDLSKSPTLTDRMTQPGVILGTAAYMSPEQARSHPVDKRIDIWAFGCVLYECLTGKLAFPGETFSDTLTHIIKGEPDWTQLPPNTPQMIRILLHRCMQKDSRKRLHDIADARIEIEEALSHPTSAGIEEYEEIGASQSPSKKHTVPWALAAILALAAAVIASIAVWNLKPRARTELKIVKRFTIDLPEKHLVVAPEFGNNFAISPDGKNLVYTEYDGKNHMLYLRSMDQLESTPIQGTDNANHPFFSPDGRQIGFSVDGELRKTYLTGGNPQTICKEWGGATWAPDGTIIFGGNKGLYRVPSSGGTPELITKIDEAAGETEHGWPEILPGGNHVLFTTGRQNVDDTRLAIYSLETEEYHILMDEVGFNARYVDTGHLVYVHGGDLMAVTFDINKMKITGSPIVLPLSIRYGSGGAAHYDISSDGTLIYLPGSDTTGRGLIWVDRQGNKTPLQIEKRGFILPSISPDGRKVALWIIERPVWEIWIYDIELTSLSPLNREGRSARAAWTPDGEKVIFSSDMQSQGKIFNLYAKRIDGSGEAERLFESENSIQGPSISAEGDLLAFYNRGKSGNYDIGIFNISEERASIIIDSEGDQIAPSVYPNGRWIAYASDETGRFEVYVSPVSGKGSKYRISADGGTQPVWSRDGKELFYRMGISMMSVPIEMNPSFKHGKPKKLFEIIAGRGLGATTNYDIHPDGNRFLMIDIPEEVIFDKIQVVTNWTEELKRLVPTKK